MTKVLKKAARPRQTEEDLARGEIDRVNARLRHFRGVAVHVMDDALGIWRDLWEACQDLRSWEEILDDAPEPEGRIPAGGWTDFREKLHLLGTYLDYAKRLCEGSLEK
ncbi:MAG: hypothetical protein FJ128_07175 [Deltaproteobacteria bacterium]|nr:hypothetical protein [Deltaproteobacteria bacterium]